MFRCFEDSNFRIRIHWRGRFYGARLAGSKQLFQLRQPRPFCFLQHFAVPRNQGQVASLTGALAIYRTLELDRSWTQNSGVNPLDGTNYLDTVSAFIEGFLHLLAGEGSGEGDGISVPFRSSPFEIFPLFSLFSKNTIVALRDSAGLGVAWN